MLIRLVPGGSRGIGRAIAEVFAKVGATVVICGRDQSALDEVARDNAFLPGKIVPLQCHLAHLPEMEALVTNVLTVYGRIDILVNNAATNIFHGPCLELGETEFDKAVEIIKSVHRMTRLVGPAMLLQGSGSIINIAATAGIRPEPFNLLEHLRDYMFTQLVQYLGHPEEIAEVVLMLASERASFVTGQVFILDGGCLLS